ncbi:MAG: hypothetical protein PVG86_02005 [Desulfobacterales bacterium]
MGAEIIQHGLGGRSRKTPTRFHGRLKTIVTPKDPAQNGKKYKNGRAIADSAIVALKASFVSRHHTIR